MNGHVLVLNQDYRAITLCSVQRAIILVFLQKADLVAVQPGRFVRSPSLKFPWPSIVRLKAFIRLPYRNIMISRKNILRRDQFVCQYCGAHELLTVDHVYPKSRGGRDTWENLVAACTPCNNRKGNRTPDEANMSLKRKPYRPSHVMFIRDFIGTVEEHWKPYLFLS